MIKKKQMSEANPPKLIIQLQIGLKMHLFPKSEYVMHVGLIPISLICDSHRIIYFQTNEYREVILIQPECSINTSI